MVIGVGGFGFRELGLSEMLLCLGPLSCPIQESLLRQVCVHEGWRFRVWVSLNPKQTVSWQIQESLFRQVSAHQGLGFEVFGLGVKGLGFRVWGFPRH